MAKTENRKKVKRIPLHTSLSPRGTLELAVLKAHRCDATVGPTIEWAIHDKYSRLDAKVKERIEQEHSVCPFASVCAELLQRYKEEG